MPVLQIGEDFLIVPECQRIQLAVFVVHAPVVLQHRVAFDAFARHHPVGKPFAPEKIAQIVLDVGKINDRAFRLGMRVVCVIMIPVDFAQFKMRQMQYLCPVSLLYETEVVFLHLQLVHEIHVEDVDILEIFLAEIK